MSITKTRPSQFFSGKTKLPGKKRCRPQQFDWMNSQGYESRQLSSPLCKTCPFVLWLIRITANPCFEFGLKVNLKGDRASIKPEVPCYCSRNVSWKRFFSNSAPTDVAVSASFAKEVAAIIALPDIKPRRETFIQLQSTFRSCPLVSSVEDRRIQIDRIGE